jgi:hypothetical protein
MSHNEEKYFNNPIAINQINSFFLSVTGPLNVKYCNLFYALTWLIFIFIVIFVTSGIYGIIIRKGKVSLLEIILGIIALFFYFFIYIIYRVFYNMCLHSL